MSLIDRANAYAAFYKWFVYLSKNGVTTLGYVIMPNHFHGIFYVSDNCERTINQLLANGKRFIAYDIIKRLEELKREDILQELFHSTTDKEKNSGKKHRVFKTSSDIKELHSSSMILTKLEYIHRNPCQGRWNLVDDFTTYKHSSAAFYDCEQENNYVTDYREYF
ncbi:MAG: hypothetical protein ACI9GO_000913 [Bacteroidia bacterium]|jgi:hypothetical protein